MSLRARLLSAIAFALVLSFAVDLGLAAWRDTRSIRAELVAARDNAADAATAALADIPPGADVPRAVRRVLATFDRGRHMRAELLAQGGAVRAASTLAVAGRPPRWYVSLVAPRLAPVTIPVASMPGIAALRLVADPTNEAFERWSALRDSIGLMALFCAVAGGLCSAIVTIGLRPLSALSRALASLGHGQADLHLAQAGPPEVALLATEFNRFAAALGLARQRNARLEEQLITIAEDERADLARNLHDDVGPLLFAISAYTATIGRAAQSGDPAAIAAHVAAIQEAIATLQADVRDMLGRLHDPQAPAPCLAASLGALVAFWNKVQPDTAIELEVEVEEASLSDAARETLVRIAQESISNAVRHGLARHLRLRAHASAEGTCLQVTDDGAGTTAAGDKKGSGKTIAGNGPAGFGLDGMRARAQALGGRLDIRRGTGWTVTATLPRQTTRQTPRETTRQNTFQGAG